MREHGAVCGCIVKIETDYRGDIQRIVIAKECDTHRRAEPAPAPLLTEADTLRAELREMGRFADALETRVTTLETVAGFGPRAGDGYREIPAGERGEGEDKRTMLKVQLTDGHGNYWDPYCPVCGRKRQVIGPGVARCPNCD